MRVGITGGSGFVGKKLALRHLDAGDTVKLLSRRPSSDLDLPDAVQVCAGDLLQSAEALKPFVDGVDVLYHCAGEVRNQQKMYAVHIDGTKKLCLAARGNIGHWVQLSSVGVYGPQLHGIVTEETEQNPQGTYEKTKAESDQAVENAAQEGFFSYSILRPSIIFGSAMTNQSLWHLIAMVDRGLFFFIGKAGASANYIHVDNVVEGLIRCGTMSTAKGEVYNLSDYRTIEQFVAAIANELGRSCPKFRLPRRFAWLIARSGSWIPRFPLTGGRVSGLTSRGLYSNEKIQHELEYQHRVSLEEGVHEMVGVWRQEKK